MHSCAPAGRGAMSDQQDGQQEREHLSIDRRHAPWLNSCELGRKGGTRMRSHIAALVATSILFASAPSHAQSVRQDLWGTDGPVNVACASGNILYIGGNFTQVGPVSGPGAPISASTGQVTSGFPKVVGSPGTTTV